MVGVHTVSPSIGIGLGILDDPREDFQDLMGLLKSRFGRRAIYYWQKRTARNRRSYAASVIGTLSIEH